MLRECLRTDCGQIVLQTSTLVQSDNIKALSLGNVDKSEEIPLMYVKVVGDFII
jgi:hypothetical protein